MNPLQSLVIRQHQQSAQDRRNAARYGDYLIRRERYLRALSEGRHIRLPLQLVRA